MVGYLLFGLLLFFGLRLLDHHRLRLGLSIAVVSQLCYSGVTVVLQWCYSGVTVVLQWCYSGVAVGKRTFFAAGAFLVTTGAALAS
jgi:hypothetical protein